MNAPKQKRVVLAGGFAPNVPKPVSHRVKLRAVACPECSAPVGEPCRSATSGRVVAVGHRSRKRLATRLDNEQRGL